jgi:branched-chain amino acid transport system permease protein
MLGLALGIGIGLWLWLQKTRTGMIIRAGVDDRAMVSALGINVQLIFALAFFVGSALVGFGGVVGGSQFGLQTHTTDAQWLVNSLVVVIVGGMGSLGGAAVGALLYGLVSNLSPVYLPTITDSAGTSNCCTEYSIIFTFALLVVVLAVRPLGLFGRPA